MRVYSEVFDTGFKVRPGSAVARKHILFYNLFISFVLVVACIIFSESKAQDMDFPLRPADTSSPRTTLANLLDNITEGYRIVEEAIAEHEANPGLFKSDSVLEKEARAMSYLQRAVGSLDLSQIPRATREFVSIETALQIKEVLDRLHLPPMNAIPDADTATSQGLTRWRVPQTSIDIVLIDDGPRQGEFLFSSETVAQSGAMYRTIADLPYVTTDTKGAYELFVSTPGRLLSPKWLTWVEDLPDWMHHFYYGKAIWQWIALVLTLLAAFLVPVLVSRWLRNYAIPENDFLRVLRRLAVPGSALAGLWFAEYILIWYINFSGQSLVFVLTSLLIPISLLGAYLGYLLVLLATEAIITSPRIDTESLDANLLRMIASLLGGGIAVGIIFYGANNLGVPVVPLIASLGVGGLAVALAARPTIENLIGGIILYVDRPVSVGDFCSFGERMGTVVMIGMRSTQLRALDRTIITVPGKSHPHCFFVDFGMGQAHLA